MAQSGGIPGVAVGMAGAAALLVYAGFRGLDPLQALREVATGRPRGMAEQSAAREVLYEGVGSGGAGGGGVAQTSLTGTAPGPGPHPEFVTAASRFQNDQYSQARRWQDGYSDCSSFVGKALKACGITPPGASVTTSYLAWRQLRPISRGEIGAGDLLVSSGHIAIAVDGRTAIGQQNARQDVVVGPISQVMWGQSWVPLRYTGPSGGSARA